MIYSIEIINSFLFFIVIYVNVLFFAVASAVGYERKRQRDTTFKKEFLLLTNRRTLILELFLMSVVLFVLFKFLL
ncbi:hypothetical protein [Candidatus Sulfurimonas baltica]|uniref:Uncharacterized protein n=1 Tax=Candidatus Sulfurimonas baltica TaxID=2740404 RepID=A0A7S7LT98_9BACT|nr:hypothetical protein [Candidatus Sulfurimonas baltica]QOY50950.1 hypothetical protein HUE88_07275 [Candidatus Sulfurimonas baltica]